MSRRRVVITGVGPVSAIGIGKEAFFAAVAAGQSGIGPFVGADAADDRGGLAAQVRDFHVEEFLESQKAYLDRSSELAFAAMALALADAGLSKSDAAEAGLCLGTAFGSLETMRLFFADLVEKGPRLVRPVLFPHAYANTAISLLAIEHGMHGFHLNVASGRTASHSAVVAAFDRIRQGKAAVVCAGGYEALSPVLMTACAQSGGSCACRDASEWRGPFDEARGGCVPGEGSAVFVLEDLEHAQSRGAPILAELAGAGLTGCWDVANEASVAIRDAMGLALQDAAPAIELPSCISASACGDAKDDRAEAAALSALLCHANRAVPVTAVKSLVGEAMGAGGALQIAAALAMLEQGAIPAIHALRAPDADWPLDFVRDRTRRQEVAGVLVNAYDPGGSAASLLLRRNVQGMGGKS